VKFEHVFAVLVCGLGFEVFWDFDDFDRFEGTFFDA